MYFDGPHCWLRQFKYIYSVTRWLYFYQYLVMRNSESLPKGRKYLPKYSHNFGKYKNFSQEMAKKFWNFAFVAKFAPIWSHCPQPLLNFQNKKQKQPSTVTGRNFLYPVFSTFSLTTNFAKSGHTVRNLFSIFKIRKLSTESQILKSFRVLHTKERKNERKKERKKEERWNVAAEALKINFGKFNFGPRRNYFYGLPPISIFFELI